MAGRYSLDQIVLHRSWVPQVDPKGGEQSSLGRRSIGCEHRRQSYYLKLDGPEMQRQGPASDLPVAIVHNEKKS
jgi:hypothetical protein